MDIPQTAMAAYLPAVYNQFWGMVMDVDDVLMDPVERSFHVAKAKLCHLPGPNPKKAGDFIKLFIETNGHGIEVCHFSPGDDGEKMIGATFVAGQKVKFHICVTGYYLSCQTHLMGFYVGTAEDKAKTNQGTGNSGTRRHRK